MEHTTIAVQRYLDEMGERSSGELLVGPLLDRAVRRLHQLCAAALYRRYPRLTRPPLNLASDEVLGAVVERLLKALRDVRPTTTRQFFALVSRHIRWELNDMARRLDDQMPVVTLQEGVAATALPDSVSGLTADARRILAAIEELPEPEREAFDLVRVQGPPQLEAARVIGVSAMTVNRRLHRALQRLAVILADLYPGGEDDDPGPTADCPDSSRPVEEPPDERRRPARAAAA